MITALTIQRATESLSTDIADGASSPIRVQLKAYFRDGRKFGCQHRPARDLAYAMADALDVASEPEDKALPHKDLVVTGALKLHACVVAKEDVVLPPKFLMKKGEMFVVSSNKENAPRALKRFNRTTIEVPHPSNFSYLFRPASPEEIAKITPEQLAQLNA